MGLGSLPDVTGPGISLDDPNDTRAALRGDFVGRNTSGAAASSQNLGTAAIPWGTLYTSNVNVGGQIIDFDNIGAANSRNGVISGATRTASGQPDFLRAAGTGGGASFDILATTTSLVYTADGTSATISADVTVSSLTTAPASNNTCDIDDTSFAGGTSTKYEGEGIGSITVDAMGSELTSRVGQYVALQGSSEIMMAYIEDSTTLRNIFRGFFFDDSGDPIVRETLSNNDTLTLLSLGWIFAEDNGTTIDVSYRSPYIQNTEPSSPSADDYWFDIANDKWKRYDGANFIDIDRTLIGWCVVDGTDCIATRSIDFAKSFSDFAEITTEVSSNTQIRSRKAYSGIYVYGSEIQFHGAPVIWDITTDLETGLTEASDTQYYLYITDEGATKISYERPYDRTADLKGYYHPYHSWRAVGTAYNDGSSNLTGSNSVYATDGKQFTRYIDFTSSDTFVPGRYDIIDDLVYVEVIGGGGGGGRGSGGIRHGGCAGGYAAGQVDLTGVSSVTVTIGSGGNGATGTANGSNGGTSSFGSYLVATGGEGGKYVETDKTVNSYAEVFAAIEEQVPGVGRGSSCEVSMQGSRGEAKTSTTTAEGGLGFGGVGANGFGTGSTSIYGQGGASFDSSNGRDGYDGFIRVWY